MKHKLTAKGEKVSAAFARRRNPIDFAMISALADIAAERRKQPKEPADAYISTEVPMLRERKSGEVVKVYERKMEIIQMQRDIRELQRQLQQEQDIAKRNRINYKIYQLRKKRALAIGTFKAIKDFETDYNESLNPSDNRI